jgi:hypothetical protein
VAAVMVAVWVGGTRLFEDDLSKSHKTAKGYINLCQ